MTDAFYSGESEASPDQDWILPGPSPCHHQARDLLRLYGDWEAEPLLRVMIRDIFPGRIALVSSFGAESAVLLALVAGVDPATPVLFLDTGKLFPETLVYRDRLVAQLGLKDVRVLEPEPRAIAREDTYGELWRIDADRCCALRKIEPLERGLAGFEAWITGRKRFQGGQRSNLATIEAEPSGRIKINPLAAWSMQQIVSYFAASGLPPHPLEQAGYRSIGCLPCTAPVAPGEDPRAGRWCGRGKTECGIHRPARA